MPEPTLITYTFKELATLLVKDRGIHEGYWGIYAKFGITAANAGPSDADLRPTALVPILELGLQKAEGLNNLTVDAAEVNPAPKGASKGAKKDEEEEARRARAKRMKPVF